MCLSSSAVFHRSIRLQARTVIQQCSHAKVKIKPAIDGADAQWVEVSVFVALVICFVLFLDSVGYELLGICLTVPNIIVNTGRMMCPSLNNHAIKLFSLNQSSHTFF